MFDGQMMAGALVSLIVTLNMQALMFPLPSVAVQVTVVRPFGKIEPLGGTQITVTLVQLSLAVTVKLTLLRKHWPGSALAMMFAGQVMEGALVSIVNAAKPVLTLPP